jgi:DHA3 family tetracycline resistance protein-like MFS transporter
MRKLDAYVTYLVSEGALALSLSMIFTVNLVYQVEIAHLNPLQLVLVGTVLEATVFVLEIPTGIVADMYSRRLSVVIGMILVGLGFVLEGSVPRWETILLAQVLWGTGYTFTSGAMEAWISDEIGEHKAGRAFLRASQVGQAGDLIGIPISVALAGLSLQAPIILGGLLISALGLFLLALMPERGFSPSPHAKRRTKEHMAETFHRGLSMIRRRPALLTILSAIAVYGAFTEGFDRLWTPHLLTNFALPTFGAFEPVAWFGVIRAAGVVLALVATEIVRRRVDTTSHVSLAHASMVINGLLMVCIVTFGAATDFVVALLVLLAIQPLRRMIGPIQTAWVNQGLDSQVRATVISMSAQADALGQIIGGPILGMIATLSTTRVEMIAAGVTLAPVLWLYARTLSQRQALAQAPLESE